jgi:RNA polymerase sigma factor (sigma-70 family)
MTDAALVTAARSGDRDAFAALAERHRRALLRACGGSADAAQDALLIAMTSLAALRDDAAFGAWLCGIGRNLARRETATLNQGSDPCLRVGAVREAPDPLLRDRVWAAIAALPAGQREAVALFYLADLSHAQIAARLGISVGAVKTRLHKARAALQAPLADLRREPPAMPTVPMRVADVTADGDLAIMLLEEAEGGRRLPIWIPPAEAAWLAKRLRDEEHPRPDTYRFTADLLAAAGAVLREVRVVRLADEIFYAEAVLADGTAIDARPSDAVNLALVTGVPILVEASVLTDPTVAGGEA